MTKEQLLKVIKPSKKLKRVRGPSLHRHLSLLNVEIVSKPLLAKRLHHFIALHYVKNPVATPSVPGGMQADPAVVPPSAADQAQLKATRAKRFAAIMSVHGIWKNDPEKPQDSVAYQREARAEWQ